MNFLTLTTISLLPILIFQGKTVRRNTPRLPEPTGVRYGTKGTGKKLNILIIGDSAAAGVGVKHQDDALLGHLTSELTDHYQLSWKLEAKTGDASKQLFQVIHQLEIERYDIVITSIGVNDITQLISPKNWIKKQKQLYKLITEKFNPSLIIATGVPPMQLFPALPNPLAWLFGLYAKEMNEQLVGLVNNHSNLDWIEYDLEKYKHLNIKMAEDGFHPSKEIYRLWAKELADKIRKKF